MKVVVDTSVIVAALRSRHGYSNRLLQLAYFRSIRMLASPALFLEWEEVLTRPEQCAVHGMTQKRMDEFLIGLAGIIEPVRIYYHLRPQLQDADDEMVLETAINGGAEVIATHNVRDFAPIANRFKVRVLSPRELVKEVPR